MQSSQIKQKILPVDVPIRAIDFSFIHQNNQVINSLQQEFNRFGSIRMPQNIQNRGYQWTFKKPDDIKFDYSNLKRLQIIVAQNQQKFNIQQEQALKQQQLKKEIQIQNKPIFINHKNKTQTEYSYRQKALQSNFNNKMAPQKSIYEVSKRISKIIMAQNNRQFVQLNVLLPNVYEDEVLFRKNSEDFKQETMNVSGNQYISFSKMKFELNGVNKIKIYHEKCKGKCFKIKLVHNKIQYFLGVQLNRDLYYLPKHYVWFAKLINSKLMHMKYNIQIKDGNKLVDTNYGLGGIFAEGAIYKCSKYKKKWQKRHVVINTEGIFSYVKPSDHYTISIPTQQLEQLWTNFQTIYNHLIIKLAYKSGKKIQFAIPIQDYCLREESNWLFAFYRILMEYTIHIKCICG